MGCSIAHCKDSEGLLVHSDWWQEGVEMGNTGGIQIFSPGGKFFFVRKGKSDKTRKIKKSPKDELFSEIM